ncbi:MAG: hypothetical protein ACHBN1_30830 [Heteroscytonema crispum UTEX LB 1556]
MLETRFVPLPPSPPPRFGVFSVLKLCNANYPLLQVQALVAGNLGEV